MRILVVGSTGGTGREIVRQGLERGHSVTAFVRNPERLKLEHARLSVARGNVLDPNSLKTTMDSQDAVLCALGHKRWFIPNRILSDGTANIVSAMKAKGVRRLICETSLGVGDSFGRLGLYYTLFTIPVILPLYYYDKSRQEKVIMEGDLDWTIVRPGMLNNAPARGTYRHGPKIGSYLWSVRISRADVAGFMLDQLENSPYIKQATGVAW